MEELDIRYEEIDYSFEDLLIFPTVEGLRRSTAMIQSYFAMEEQIMKQCELDIINEGQYFQSTIVEQQAILEIAKYELNNRAQGSAYKSCETGWIPAPKGIDKGIDKNVAARLASVFTNHADRFKKELAMQPNRLKKMGQNERWQGK